MLAKRGYFPEEELKSFKHFGPPFAMHPDSRKVIGCDASAGSLGHDLPMANMTVICPADGIETSKAVRACMDVDGSVYMRIGRGFEPPVYENEDYVFTIGSPEYACYLNDYMAIIQGMCC